MGFIVETSLQGLFVVTEESIHHYDQKNESESKGLLVRSHFDDVYKTLWVANLIKEGNVFESKFRYGEKPDESSDKSPPRLVVCLDALEKLLSRTTDGEYETAVGLLGREKNTPAELNKHKYWGEIQDIFWYIKELREGKYVESESLRYKGRRGIPRITTTGRRLVDSIMDLFWKMDSSLPNKWTY